MIRKFKNITKIFILSQILDFVTTYIGVVILGFREMNPMGLTINVVIFKLFATVFVAFILEKFDDLPFAWVLPTLQWIIVIWNIINIAFYFV